MNDAFHVYQLFREDGLLLYVGFTNNLKRRTREHRRQWYGGAIATVSSDAFETKRAAMSHEAHLINAHRPPWNLTGRASA